jgi:hypothetical protein
VLLESSSCFKGLSHWLKLILYFATILSSFRHCSPTWNAVDLWVFKFHELGCSLKRKSSGETATTRAQDMIANARVAVLCNFLIMPNQIVHQILHEDLNNHLFEVMVGQELLLNVCNMSNSKSVSK